MTSNRTIRIIIAAGMILSILSLVISFMAYYKQRKIGFVDTIRLVNEYKFKTDLENQESKRLDAIQAASDSFKTLYSMMAKAPRPDTVRMGQIMGQVKRLSGVFQREYERSNQDINEKVWKRLNPAISEFARKHHMELLIGANGMGTVLYGNHNRDYTTEVIQYVNQQY